MYILQNLHWFVALIGALVFFHELGHFIVAKACGVKVEKFSLGFGPHILRFVRGETEYRLAILPLGGYVKMLGEVPGSQIPPEEAHRAFNSKPVWQRAAIAFAGPAFNLILALFVYFAMFTGTQTFGATKLGIVTVGDPAWQAGLRPGDTIVAVNGTPVSDWDTMREHIASHPGQNLKLSYERELNGEKISKEVELKPDSRSEANMFQEQEQRGRIGVSVRYLKAVIAVIDAQSPAAQAGLKTDDLVLKVGEQNVGSWHELRNTLRAAPAGQNVPLTVKRGSETLTIALVPQAQNPLATSFPDLFSSADGEANYTGLVSKDSIITEVDKDTPAAKVDLKPGDRVVALSMNKDGVETKRPLSVWSVDLGAFSGEDARNTFVLTIQRGTELLEKALSLTEQEEQDELKNVHKFYVFGARNDTSVVDTYTFERRVGLAEAFKEAAVQVGSDMTLIGVGLAKLINGRIPLNTMGGPIMLFVIAEKSAKKGVGYFLRILAMISVNLGLLNLLPIPVLDGGHLLFCAIEAIRRRPPSLRVREFANVVGLALLLLLMVLAFRNDILRFVLG